MKDQHKLEEHIEELELDEVEPEQFEEIVSAFSKRGLLLRRERKNIRYVLYRLKTEQEGKGTCDATLIKQRTGLTKAKFKAKFEKQDQFSEWKFFGINWDVDFIDPWEVIHRDHTDQEKWENLVASKFPSFDPATGRVTYPDMKVKQAVEKHLEERKS